MTNEYLINRYFENALSEEERIIFDQLMQEDSEFAEEVAFQKMVKNAIALNEQQKLKSQLQSFEADLQKPQKRTSKQYWMSGAAAAVLILMTSWFFINNNQPSSNELFKQYYQTFPNVVKPIVRGHSDMDSLSKAYMLYELGQYPEAAQYFANGKDANEIFYAGLTDMELQKYTSAIDRFQSIEKVDFSYSTYVDWYMALAYLKLNKTMEAKNYLVKLKDQNNFEYNIQVKELLNQLD